MPGGNVVAASIALSPSEWFKIMDPLAKAINAGEKVSEEVKKITDEIIRKKFIFNALLVSYFCFF